MSKRALSSLFAAAVATAALATSPGALAQQGESFTTNELNVHAASYADTPEGCLIVDLFITYVKTTASSPINGFSSLFIHRSSNNCATHLVEGGFLETLVWGFTSENPTELTVNQRLTSGTLKTTMPASFHMVGEGQVSIDLVFDGIEGTLSPWREFNRPGGGPQGPDVWHIRGYIREATASGSVSDGTRNYMANPYAVQGYMRRIDTRMSSPKPRMFH